MRPGLPHHYILPTLGHLRRNTAKRTLRLATCLVRARRYGKREYVPLRLHWPQAIADSDHGKHMAVKTWIHKRMCCILTALHCGLIPSIRHFRFIHGRNSQFLRNKIVVKSATCYRGTGTQGYLLLCRGWWISCTTKIPEPFNRATCRSIR